MRVSKSIGKKLNYKARCIKISQMENKNWKAVVGTLLVVAPTENEAICFIKSLVDTGW